MAYADKCFYFDWGNRKIKLQDFDDFGEITLRKRGYYTKDYDDYENYNIGVSIELWGKEKGNGERYEDKEIVLSRDDAMILATKLTRAVAELDADDYREHDLNLLYDLEQIHYKKLDELHERRRELKVENNDKKGGLGGALNNFLDTPMGKDALKEMKGE